MPKSILLSISDGMVERNLLKTDFFSLLLATGVRVHIVCSNKPYFSYLQKNHASDMVSVHYLPYKISRIDALFNLILKHNIHTQTIADIEYYSLNGIYGHNKISLPIYLGFRILWHLGQFKAWRNFIRYLYRTFDRATYGNTLIHELKPDLIFVPSITPSDYKLVQQASQLGIPCVQMLKSWDNLTTKTFMAILPDLLVTHNELMKQEAIELDDMPADRVMVTGIPQFDYLNAHKAELIEPRDVFYAKLGIDPKKKVVLFSASGDLLSPNDRDYLFILDKAITDGSLPADIHIQVRSHPKFHSSFTGVEALKHVTVEQPFTYLTEGTRDWVFEDDDVKHWYNSLYHSIVTINVASTMSIDAAVVGRPAICLAFDGYATVPEPDSISRYYGREHYLNIMKSGAVALAKNQQELVDAIKEIIDNPDIRKKERERLINEQCYKLDGNASKRLVTLLSKALEDQTWK